MQLLQKISAFCAVFLFLLSSAFADLPSGSQLGPTANFSASSTSVILGQKVDFDASASRDARGSTSLSYRWDFESKYEWTSWSRSSKASHIFTDSGSKYTRLQVKDSDGFIDETKVLIRVKSGTGTGGPITKFFVDPIEGTTDTAFRFTVDTFSQIGTSSHLLEVRWDWNRDGEWDTDWSRGRSFYHSFESSGSKEVWLQTKDINGATSTEKGYYVVGEESDQVRTKEIGRIKVSTTGAPRASFRTWPVNIRVGTNVHFDAEGSLRAEKFRWDFDGDGNFDTSFSKNKKIQYVYKKMGVFSATLEVRSESGDTDRTERTVVVADPNNILPEAKLTVRNQTNSFSGSDFGVLLDEFYFNAGSSKDADGSESKMQVRWDFDGNGIFDTTFSTTKTAKHKYTKTGIFRPRVQVLDERGGSAIAQGDPIRIVANTAPEAKLKVTPTIGTLATEFRFDASETLDNQTGSRDLEYRFDFDGDGRFDTEFKTSKTARHKFLTSGKKTAMVEVRDHKNAISRARVSFEVAATQAPKANFVVVPQVGTFNTNFKFDASNTVGSTVVEDKLFYRWDFDYKGMNDINFDTNWSTSPKTTHRYKEVGDYSVHLVVKNSTGEQSDFYQTVRIHENSPYFALLKNKNIISNESVEGLVTRAEFAQIIAKAAGLKVGYSKEQVFVDVEKSNPQNSYINAVAERGWISPKSQFRFDPNGTLNRAEASKIVISALYPRVAIFKGRSTLRDVPASAWFYRFANIAVAEGLIDVEFGRFLPAQAVTRAEAVKMVAMLVDKYGVPQRRAFIFSPEKFMSSLSRLIHASR